MPDSLVLHKEIGCEDCQTQWKHYCPLCKAPARSIWNEDGERVTFAKSKPKVITAFQNNRFQLKLIYRSGKKIKRIDGKRINPKSQTVKAKKEKIILKPKHIPETALQPLPITWENFFLATKGAFEEIHEIPYNFKSFFKSKGSEYFINEDKTILIRKSDHWGFGIRNCHWYLKGYPRLHCGTWQKKQEKPLKIGIINISELEEAKKTKKRTFQAREFILTNEVIEKINKL